MTHYWHEAPPEQKPELAIRINRAFRAWGHRFLWNREILAQALEACGFDSIRWCDYGESELEVFRGLERHERWLDASGLPHVLIVEARKGLARPEALRALRDTIRTDLVEHVNVAE